MKPSNNKLQNNKQLDLEIQFASQAIENKWSNLIVLKDLRRWVKAAIQQDAQILIRFVGRSESKQLNTAYRSQDHATNVLTFTLTAENNVSVLIADLVLCMPVIEVEAKRQNKSIENHLAHLVVHGVLHAQGFDHEEEIDALAMESLEIAILKKLKIQNPYI